MAVITGSKRALDITVELRGVFFKNPVGKLHMNLYRVLRAEGAFALRAVRDLQRSRQRRFGGGYDDVELIDQLRAVPMRMRGARARLVVSANYGSRPLVRKYNRWNEDASTNRPRGAFKGHHVYRDGARQTQAHIDGRIGSIANELVEGLT